MKLSTKGRYGVRAMYDLALTYGEGPQTVRVIAQRQGVPEAYLEQLIARMRKAGLVTSIRGAHGGYVLAATPEKITIGAILRAAEGSLAPAHCVMEDEEACENACGCAMHILWERIHVGVNELLGAMTLQDMIDDAGDQPSTVCKC